VGVDILAIPDEPTLPHSIVGYPQCKDASERGLVASYHDAGGNTGSYGGCEKLCLSEGGVVVPQMHGGSRLGT